MSTVQAILIGWSRGNKRFWLSLLAPPTIFTNSVMPDKKEIKVAVFLANCGKYGVPGIVISQAGNAKAFGIDFHYVLVEKDYLYHRLSDSGADVRVLGERVPNAYPPSFFKLILVFLSHLKHSFSIFRKIRAYLKQTSPNLLYTHNITEHILGGLAAKSCGIRSVGHSHVMYNPKRNLGLSRIIVSLAMNCSLNMVLAVSNSARNSLWGPVKRKTYPIYGCRDIQHISEIANSPPAEKHSPAPDIVYIGRLVKIKKQDVLVEALGILAREGPTPKTFLVSGENDESNPYYVKLKQQISRLGLEKYITFSGFVTEPYEILAKAKVSVLCCTREGCPNLVPESFACHTPIVVPDAGGAGELVEDGVTGLKFIPDDPASLASCLRRLLENEQLRKKLAENAFAQANKSFNCEVHMAELRKRLEQVLESR